MIASGSEHDRKLVEDVCHADTWTTFGLLFGESLAKVLSVSSTAAQTVETYFSALKAVIADEAHVLGAWMTDEDRRAAVARARALQVTAFGASSSLYENEVGGTGFDAAFGMRKDHWIYNKVTVMKRTRIADDVDSFSRAPAFSAGNVGRYETELSADANRNLVSVPYMFALPPLFFDDVPGASNANIALLGVQMARQALRLLVDGAVASASWSKQTMTAYEELKKCYANSSFAFHGQLDDEQFGDATATALAIRYAFLSRMDMTLPSDDDRFSSKQLFFRRACLSFCAGGKQRADFDSLDRDTASASCTLGVSSMPAFHETFGCTRADPMAQPRMCKM
ncbi:uncharacterized protein LOC142564951 [Dermacentor variabilis]|uniref:uncharacterized protein LOC142564951 n=1 Tax=Dermacentor variabilis TaxID=34621 RepID=UPI003F5B60BB